jgi:hypothetical protein
VTKAIVALEHALQAKDAVEKKIGFLIPLPAHDLTFMRLRNTASQAYLALDVAVRNGWMMKKTFDTEFARARAAVE